VPLCTAYPALWLHFAGPIKAAKTAIKGNTGHYNLSRFNWHKRPVGFLSLQPVINLVLQLQNIMEYGC